MPNTNPSRRASVHGLGLPNETDEVVALGARLGAAMKREDELEDKSIDAREKKDGSGKIYFDTAAVHSYDESCTIRDLIAITKAQTLSGAAIQIVEAMSRVDRIWDEFTEGAETPNNRRDKRAIERLLFSALDQIEEKIHRKVEELVHPNYPSRNLDPWIPVEERLKVIEEEGKP
jgi:hypothetical protein